MAMTAPGGWRVVPIRVERGGRVLDLYRVTHYGVFVCECRTPAEVAAAGVPMGELHEEETPGQDMRPITGLTPSDTLQQVCERCNGEGEYLETRAAARTTDEGRVGFTGTSVRVCQVCGRTGRRPFGG